VAFACGAMTALSYVPGVTVLATYIDAPPLPQDESALASLSSCAHAMKINRLIKKGKTNCDLIILQLQH